MLLSDSGAAADDQADQDTVEFRHLRFEARLLPDQAGWRIQVELLAFRKNEPGAQQGRTHQYAAAPTVHCAPSWPVRKNSAAFSEPCGTGSTAPPSAQS